MGRSSNVGLVARSGVFAVGYGTDYAEKFRHLPLYRRR
jgi:hypoxanthine-guanine phosphoribosyltransferase